MIVETGREKDQFISQAGDKTGSGTIEYIASCFFLEVVQKEEQRCNIKL